jgi:SUKH-3 immunity protein
VRSIAFSKATRALLQKAGWHDERKIETAGYEEALRKRGYPVHNSVLQFLQNFGGLLVLHPHGRVPLEEDRFHFDASKAASSVDISRVLKDYNPRIGSPLCVIGQAFREYMVLLMDSDGRIYAGYDRVLVKVGDSPVEAIEALCTGKQLSKVP